MNRITRKELVAELASQGLRLQYVGCTWCRGYVSRLQLPHDNVFFPSRRRGSWYSRNCDYFCFAPAFRSTQYCHREWYKVVPLDGSSRVAAS